MSLFSNKFERNWTLIFFGMYFLIMIPLPFFYSTEYRPLFAGIPSFIFGWTAHTAVTMALIFVFYRQAIARPEYHEFDDWEEKEASQKEVRYE